jgi:hypothetical protein
MFVISLQDEFEFGHTRKDLIQIKNIIWSKIGVIKMCLVTKLYLNSMNN